MDYYTQMLKKDIEEHKKRMGSSCVQNDPQLLAMYQETLEDMEKMLAPKKEESDG